MVSTSLISPIAARSLHCEPNQAALLQGEILLISKPHTAWGASVTAQMYLSITPQQAWSQLTNYSRWVEFFPALTRSEVVIRDVANNLPHASRCQCLHQVASKDFWLFTAYAEVYLDVVELPSCCIQFRLRSGNFQDFFSELQLQALQTGTALSYNVQATPTIPIPAMLIQQAIQLDLPANMRNMRQVLSQSA